jgi:hypothetical protein
MEERFFIASPRGDGCGVALLKMTGGKNLILSVLPKLWTSHSNSSTGVDDLVHADSSDIHLVVHEMQVFSLTSRSKEVLDEIAIALTSLQFDDSSDDAEASTGYLRPLFQEVARPSSFRGETLKRQAEIAPHIHAKVDNFWEGIRDVDGISLVRTPVDTPLDDPALLGGRLFDFVPSLEQILRDLFLVEAEKALKRRRPDFRTVVDDLPFIRGSLTPNGLRKSGLGAVTELECVFADLDHDHPWQQVIRSAARIVASRDLEDGVGHDRIRLCRRIDQNLWDVSRVPSSNLLRHRFDERILGKNRHASIAARLAVAVIQRDHPAGHASDGNRSVAAVTGLRVSTPKLFELMLAHGKAVAGYRIAENTNRIALLRDRTPTKKPDLLLVRSGNSVAVSIEHSSAVIDAKYKSRAAVSPETMEMSDQYQQFAYAATTGKRTVFIFAEESGSSTRLSEWRKVNVQGSIAEVAVGAIPFPQPGRPWKEQINDSLQELVPIIVDAGSEV